MAAKPRNNGTGPARAGKARHTRVLAPKRKARRGARGALIAFEGLDGAGKKTQITLLQKWLEGAGFGVTLTRANKSALVGPCIRQARKSRALRPKTACLLRAADLAERLF